MADQENTNQNENVPNEEEINTAPVQNEEEKVEETTKKKGLFGKAKKDDQ